MSDTKYNADGGWPITAAICLGGALVAIFGHGAHAIAGAILCVGMEASAAWRDK